MAAELIEGAGIGGRIEALRRRRRWSQRDLAAEAGVSHQYLGQIERGEKTNVGAEVLERIARALGLSGGRELVEGEAPEGPGPVGVPVEVVSEGALLKVPIVGDVTAGAGYGAAAPVEDYVYVLKEEAGGRELRAVRVRGDCMEPVLYSGDVVIYEVVYAPDELPSGALCVVTLLDEGDGDGGNVKYVDRISDRIRLRAEDTAVGPKVYAKEAVKVEGRVWRMIREF